MGDKKSVAEDLVKNVDDYFEKAIAAEQSKNFGHAIFILSKAIEIDKNNKYLYFRRGELFFAQGAFKRAIIDFSKVTEIDSEFRNFLTAYERRGDCYYKLKNYEKAEEDYTQLIRLYEKIGDTSNYDYNYFKRGNCYYYMKKYFYAIEDYTKNIDDYYPEIFEECYHNRAICYLEIGEDRKALKDLKKVKSIADSYFWAFYPDC